MLSPRFCTLPKWPAPLSTFHGPDVRADLILLRTMNVNKLLGWCFYGG